MPPPVRLAKAVAVDGVGDGLTPMAAFVRIKPLVVEAGGGTASTKSISGWDESAGTMRGRHGRCGGRLWPWPFWSQGI